MNKLSVLLLSGMFAAAAFAQTGTAAPEAQMQSSPKAQAAAEANHLKKVHGNVNNAADKRLEMDHPNH